MADHNLHLFVDTRAASTIGSVEAGLASCVRQHAAAVRLADRQERFLGAIDWSQMDDDACFDGRIREDDLGGDVFYCSVQVDYFRALKDSGYTDTRQQIGWDPTRPFNVARASDAYVPFPSAEIDDLPF